jgi:hypothetical protein
MARDTWQTLRRAIRIGKKRKTLTIPAASYNCFENKGSLKNISGSTTDITVSSPNAIFNLTAALTIECWLKPDNVPGGPVATILGYDSQYFFQYLNTGKLRATFAKGGAQVFNSSLSLGFGAWNHICLTWDGTTVYLFVNGVRDSTTLALAASLDAVGASLQGLGGGFSSMTGAELKVWNRALTYDEVIEKYNKPRSFGVTGIDSGLVGYWKFNEGSGASVANKVVAYPSSFAIAGSSHTWNTTDYPPLIYGASFVIAQTDITLSKSVSLIFPKKAPSGLTGQFCVTWTDDNGVYQRRKLWTTVGADINPTLVAYSGEKLNSPFRLELWNIDGNQTVVIPTSLVFEVSDCSNPTSSVDVAQDAAATVVVDTTLAQTFPLTPFPLTFNTQQTY